MKKTDEIEKSLVLAMEQFEIIDCHEHLDPEQMRLDLEVDVFTLFRQYMPEELSSAGMTESQYQSLYDRDIPLARRWEIFKPHWENVRLSSYARAVLIAVKKFYDVDDINDNTYEQLSEAIKKNNTPGIFERVLKDACKIRLAMNNTCRAIDKPFLKPVRFILPYTVENWQQLTEPRTAPDIPPEEFRIFDEDIVVRTLDDYLDGMKGFMRRNKAAGSPAVKTASYPYGEPNRQRAVEAFNSLRDGKVEKLPFPPEMNPLRDYLVDECISYATELDMAVSVHAGYWNDFRKLDPLNMIPILQRHPDARFDIFHIGFPWVRQTLMLGKSFPNVWINLCWIRIISQQVVVIALEGALDLVTINKILPLEVVTLSLLERYTAIW